MNVNYRCMINGPTGGGTVDGTTWFNPFVGQPIRSAQNFLRKISHVYSGVPPVIPDGQFGEQTEASVRGFQNTFGLPETGEIDLETWQMLLRVYDDVGRYLDAPDPAAVYPSAQYTIRPGESSIHLYVIQAMLLSLSGRFINLIPVSVNGVSDSDTQEAVRSLQKVFGMEENGMIEKEFWNHLAALYAGFICWEFV